MNLHTCTRWCLWPSSRVTRARAAAALAVASLAIAGLAGCDTGPTAPAPVPDAMSPAPAPAATPPAPAPSPAPAPAPAAVAHYVVVFDAAWSARTHPTDFPSNPHFSPLIGATHHASVNFWGVGARASDGIRRMAEQGLTNPLDVDVRASIAAGTSHQLLLGGGIPVSPGQVSLEFDATLMAPLVTLVSMIAPSPDWFVGVAALPLLRDGQWIDEVRVDLLPYDAGTDSGATFASPDQETSPRGVITRIEGRPFLSDGLVAPMGAFTFKRLR